MESSSVCNHTHDQQIGLPLRGRPNLLIKGMITDRIRLHLVLSRLFGFMNNWRTTHALIGQNLSFIAVVKSQKTFRRFTSIITHMGYLFSRNHKSEASDLQAFLVCSQNPLCTRLNIIPVSRYNHFVCKLHCFDCLQVHQSTGEGDVRLLMKHETTQQLAGF